MRPFPRGKENVYCFAPFTYPRPDLVLLDIHLKGPRTGIDLARLLTEEAIPFVYVSANTNKSIRQDRTAG